MKKLIDYGESLFLWPWFGGITTVFGVIAGYLGSHYDQAVSSAIYPFFWPEALFSARATVFWVSVLLFGASFTGTFWAQARSSNRANGQLKAATADVSAKADDLKRETAQVSGKADVLEGKAIAMDGKVSVLDELIRELHTLPPKGFLQEYGEAVRVSAATFFGAQLPDDPEDEADDGLEVAIRAQLALVLKLATLFDEDGSKPLYGCNVMIFWPTKQIPADKVAEVEGRLLFADDGVSLAGLKGVLELVKPLSVSSADPAGPDQALSPFALPVLDLPSDAVPTGQVVSVLPGAPVAFLRRTPAFIEDPADWISQSAHLSRKVRDELEQFFERQKDTIQSFVSIPLYAEPVTATAVDPIGVLNIHRNTPNPRLSEKMQMLLPLLGPITVLTGRLLSDYSSGSATLPIQ